VRGCSPRLHCSLNSRHGDGFAITCRFFVIGLMTPGSLQSFLRLSGPDVFVCDYELVVRSLWQATDRRYAYCVIAIFGAIGTLRVTASGVVQIRLGALPYGTLLFNLTGCFLPSLIGQFTMNRLVISPDWRVAIAVASSALHDVFKLGWETAKLLDRKGMAPASVYVGASVVQDCFFRLQDSSSE